MVSGYLEDQEAGGW